jgi:arginyl-tRNA synthetase
MPSSEHIDPVGALRLAVADAVAELHGSATDQQPGIERPPRAELGDYSTNAALLAAPLIGAPPRDVAERLGEVIATRLGDAVERADVAGPGFLNLHLSDAWFRAAVDAIARGGRSFGGGSVADPLRVLVEFVSANPTGPLTVAHGRHAAYGDALARLLAFAGHEVEREYYLNDAGGQVRLFGESIAARMTGSPVPEGGYQGDYVSEIAERLAAEGAEATELEALARRGTELMRESIAESLQRFRVHFDRWSSERELHEAGAVEAGIEALREAGHVYESEGALWLRSSDAGDDKDRVLVRESGEPTYLAPDVAYHRAKLARGPDLMINVLGADHHGYWKRISAAVGWLGAPEGSFEVQIIQLVTLIEGGERAQMSKRRGEFASLDELVEDIGVDAARFFLVQRSHETPIDLDLELARSRSNDNPVYYVQYAHARIASIFRTAAERGAGTGADGESAAAVEPSERALIARLLTFPEQVERAVARREPHAIGSYARDVAADFHAFYRDCRVVGAGPGLEPARLAVCDATRIVIATALELLGIEAPEEM